MAVEDVTARLLFTNLTVGNAPGTILTSLAVSSTGVTGPDGVRYGEVFRTTENMRKHL
jgi:hypothetical protein